MAHMDVYVSICDGDAHIDRMQLASTLSKLAVDSQKRQLLARQVCVRACERACLPACLPTCLPACLYLRR